MRRPHNPLCRHREFSPNGSHLDVRPGRVKGSPIPDLRRQRRSGARLRGKQGRQSHLIPCGSSMAPSINPPRVHPCVTHHAPSNVRALRVTPLARDASPSVRCSHDVCLLLNAGAVKKIAGKNRRTLSHHEHTIFRDAIFPDACAWTWWEIGGGKKNTTHFPDGVFFRMPSADVVGNRRGKKTPLA